jgi:small subunit ribosomal protein S5
MPKASVYDVTPRVPPEQVPNATERVILIRRISKVTAGGKHLRFNALAALGDGQGHVGIGLGKADAVPDAVRKAVTIARANMIRITRRGSTIPHAIQSKYGASEVMLRPAVQGTGVKAGATVRAIMELAGLRDILTKSMGNPNPINLAKATMTALASLQDTGRGRESEREADGSADAAAETNGSGPGEGSSA